MSQTSRPNELRLLPRHRMVVAAAMLLLPGACSNDRSAEDPGSPPVDSLSLDATESFKLDAADRPFANPFIGLRGPSEKDPKHPYLSTVKKYIPWRDIEKSASDGVERIREYTDAEFSDLAAQGVRVIPRVYLRYPGEPDAWPDDLTTGDFTSDEFNRRTVNLIEKMGQAWNNDDRIVAIESGIVGWWGEQHTPFPTKEQIELFGDAYDRAFPDKTVLRRYPPFFTGRNWGLYWDSFGCENGLDILTYDPESDSIRDHADMWKSAMITGEISYNYCDVGGDTPEEAAASPDGAEKIADLMRKYHASNVGWISVVPYSEQYRAGLDLIQSSMGYAFVVEEVLLPPSFSQRQGRVTLRVANRGASPLYVDWPMDVALLERGTSNIVYRVRAGCANPRTWMPGERWNAAENEYEIAPRVHEIDLIMSFPDDVRPGRYDLAVAIVDPATGRPGLRFANRQYRVGGWTPLVEVSVGQAAPPTLPSREGLDPTGSDPLPPVIVRKNRIEQPPSASQCEVRQVP
jgi:hypothetical protein